MWKASVLESFNGEMALTVEGYFKFYRFRRLTVKVLGLLTINNGCQWKFLPSGFFACGGKLRTPSQGFPVYRGKRIQTGVLVGRFVFTPTQKVISKTFKETNQTDAFCFKLS